MMSHGLPRPLAAIAAAVLLAASTPPSAPRRVRTRRDRCAGKRRVARLRSRSSPRRWRCSGAASRWRPTTRRRHRALANVLWLNLLFQRGAVTVDHYLGSFSSQTVDLRSRRPRSMPSSAAKSARRSSWRNSGWHARPADAAGALRSRRGGRPAGVVRGNGRGADARRLPRRAARIRRARARARPRSFAQGRRADCRHLPLRGLDVVAADADDGLRRRIRRRTRRRDPDDRGGRRRARPTTASTRCSRSS